MPFSIPGNRYVKITAPASANDLDGIFGVAPGGHRPDDVKTLGKTK